MKHPLPTDDSTMIPRTGDTEDAEVSKLDTSKIKVVLVCRPTPGLDDP